MSQARTNARRRRQAANGFAHLPPRKRGKQPPRLEKVRSKAVGKGK